MSSERPRERRKGGRIRNRRFADLTVIPAKKAPSADPQGLLEDIRALEAAREETNRRMGHGTRRKR